MRVAVAGMVAGVPGQGGAAWAVLQWVLGLQRLGHDTWLVEQVPALTAERVAYYADVATAFELRDRSALVDPAGAVAGALPTRVDVLLNLAGTLRVEALLERAALRVYVDLDPVFTQAWHEQGNDVGLDGHDRFVTVGAALADPGTALPTAGRSWIATLPPVVLAHWRPGTTVERDAFTTVANWRSYGPVEHGGAVYGQKAHSLRGLLELPERTGRSFELALAIHEDESADLAALRAHGWSLVDPSAVAPTPAAYGAFVRGSHAELGVAKAGYVTSRCGWFSDRSACYLASGRPVLAQDTGFGALLPAGEGLLAFRDLEQAAAGVAEIDGAYERHAAAARALAEERLDSDRVLGDLLEAVTA